MTTTPTTETCEACGFDGGRWDRQDTIRTIEPAGIFATLAVERLDPDVAQRRPDAATWSIAEYIEHLGGFAALRLACTAAVEQPGVHLGDLRDDGTIGEPRDIDLPAAIATLDREAAAFRDLLLKLDDSQWSATARFGPAGEPGQEWSVNHAARHAVHDLLHHLDDIASIRHRLGDTVGPLLGEVAQVSASGGGVPKLALEEAEIDLGGVVGDRQATRRHHGRPWQALCLYSAEVIDAFAQQGHPIAAGSTGENLTISGIDWRELRAGLVVSIGEVTCRLSAPAVPCKKNDRWFSDGTSRRMHHDVNPGMSRWYATVLTPGMVRPGDTVTVRSEAPS